MAWTDQCKIEAVSHIDKRIEEGLTVREALKQVSSESDIPAGTLKRWKYPDVPKNGNRQRGESPQKDRRGWYLVDRRLEELIEYMQEKC